MDSKPGVREGVKRDLRKLTKEIDWIEDHSSVNTVKHIYKDNEFAEVSCNDAIKDINLGKEDGIVFIYTGHGFNNNESKWPVFVQTIYVNSVEALRKQTPFEEVINTLEQKDCRLKIAIADCCNSYSTSSLDRIDFVQSLKGISSLSFSIRKKSRLDELYAKSKGIAYCASSQPGQKSFIDHNEGSFFLSAFIDVHKELTSISGAANWETLLNKSSERTKRLAKITDKNQSPILDMSISSPQLGSIPNWDGFLQQENYYRERPQQFNLNNQYLVPSFVVAKIVFYGSNRVFFLMSNNYIVEYVYYQGVFLRGYRSYPAYPNRFIWDIVNPTNQFQFERYGIDRHGQIWDYITYTGWINVGIVYY